MSDIVIRVDDLSVSYGNVPAISDLAFNVRRGEIVCVVGPSGCGKSTMLNVLSGLLPPTHGSVSVNDQVLYRSGQPLPRLGYVFQTHRLLPWRTVRQNLELVLAAAGIPKAEWDGRIRSLLDVLQISRFIDSWPMRLSGGQRLRASIARALVIEPSYILMDEPFSTLDEVTARTMRHELSSIVARTRSTVIFVTHSIREAVFLADRLIILTRSPARVFEEKVVDIERPRLYEDSRIGQIEAEVVERVLDAWGLDDRKRAEAA
jgi:NitT/TauT family transport system ATP-binding protein